MTDRIRMAALGGLLALAAANNMPVGVDLARGTVRPLPPPPPRAPEPHNCPPKPQGLREAKRRLRQMERLRAKEKS